MASPRFLVACLNPVIQNTLSFNHLVKGEVNRSSRYRIDASGKGVNVARVLEQTDRDAAYLCQLGGPTRDWFLAMCEADGLRVRWVESGSDIRVCTTVIDEAEGSATELVQEAKAVAAGTADLVVSAFEEEIKAATMAIFSGTKASGFPADTLSRMAALAQEAGVPLVLDIKGADLQACLPYRPLVVKPNLEELLQTCAPEKAEAYRRGGLETAGLDDRALRDLVAGIGANYWSKWSTRLVVTRGPEPTLFWDGETLRDYQGPRVRALNPIGSGDSFTAGLAAVLAEGGSLTEAVAEGSRLGSLNALQLKPGAIG